MAGAVKRGEVHHLKAAMLLADLRGFSRLTDELPEEQIVELLNAFFDLVVPGRTDSAFEPSLHQHRPLPWGNAILQGRDKRPKTTPEIQSTACRDKMRARISANSGLFTKNREISV
jgi:hypothetical protein